MKLIVAYSPAFTPLFQLQADQKETTFASEPSIFIFWSTTSLQHLNSSLAKTSKPSETPKTLSFPSGQQLVFIWPAIERELILELSDAIVFITAIHRFTPRATYRHLSSSSSSQKFNFCNAHTARNATSNHRWPKPLFCHKIFIYPSGNRTISRNRSCGRIRL